MRVARYIGIDLGTSGLNAILASDDQTIIADDQTIIADDPTTILYLPRSRLR